MILAWAAFLVANVGREPQAPSMGRAATASRDQARSARASPSGVKRKIPCKTPENAPLCYWTYGRLAIYDGNPSARIWKIGTRRILGIFNGPSRFPPLSDDDFESPEFPANLERAYEADHQRWKRSKDNTPYDFPVIFGDFEVCPLEPEKKGEMQAVCIESTKNIFVQK
jgi:hypothetical protein